MKVFLLVLSDPPIDPTGCYKADILVLWVVRILLEVTVENAPLCCVTHRELLEKFYSTQI